MTDHVHEWQLIPDWNERALWYRCKHCGNEMELDEAERRLNATERLKGTQAQLYSAHIVEDPPFLIDECAADLMAYVSALDGE